MFDLLIRFPFLDNNFPASAGNTELEMFEETRKPYLE